jgi:hypothetical protein
MTLTIRIALFIALIMAVIFGIIAYIQWNRGGTEGGAGERTFESEPEAVFNDAAFGYRLLCPASWTLADYSSGDGLIRADITKGKEAGLQVRVQRQVTTPLEEYAEAYVRDFRRDMEAHWGSGLEELGRVFELPGGRRGFTITFRSRRSDGRSWFLKEYLVPMGGDVLVFQCGAPEEKRSDYEPVFDAVLKTLEFTH